MPVQRWRAPPRGPIADVDAACSLPARDDGGYGDVEHSFNGDWIGNGADADC